MIEDKAFLHVMSVLCPMHAVLDASGDIVSVGTTLQKLRPDQNLVGRAFTDVFRVLRPLEISGVADLKTHAGAMLKLQFQSAPQTTFKGVFAYLEDTGGYIVNLSFGISVLEAVREYKLTNADFAATDLTVEMLYLVEAKSAAMDASRKLISRLQAAHAAAEEKSFTDTLTGLKNRRALTLVLEQQMAGHCPFALMQVDLDFFKDVNDSLGHAAGDYVLQIVAEVLVNETRRNDTVARVGGDEFVLILHDMHDRQTLDSIAERLIAGITAPIPYQGELCQISASIGSSFYDGRSHMAASTLMKEADRALYAAKHAGRGRHISFDDLEEGSPLSGRSAY